MKDVINHNSWVEVSLDALNDNVTAFKQYIGNHTKLMAVVKGDGYGHGSVEIANEALAAGADYLAVAILEEALLLREAGISFPILVLGYTSPEEIPTAIEHDITFTVFSSQIAGKVKEIAEKQQKDVRIHIKVDSGMHRVGISNEQEALDLVKSLSSMYIVIEGIFTHFADADSTNPTYTEKQFQKFSNIINYLEAQRIFIPIKHCCNSAATIAYPRMHLDMVRVGVSLYGLYPSEHLKEKIALTQVMSLKTKLVQIKTVETQQPISYGCTFTTERESIIATMRLGYADGLSRSLSNKGSVTIRGNKAPIVGRICMDQSMIDVTDIKNIQYNDVVTIFGEPNYGYISMGVVAEQMQTIHYETACLIGKRLPRLYLREGRVVKEKGLLTKPPTLTPV